MTLTKYKKASSILTLILASSLAKSQAEQNFETLEAKFMPIPAACTEGFLEGPSYNNGYLYYTQGIGLGPGRQTYIRQLDLSKPEQGSKPVSTFACSGTWFHDGKLFSIAKLRDVGTGIASFNSTDPEKPNDYQFLVKNEIQGRAFVAVNDLVVDNMGGVYFSDKNGKAIFYRGADGNSRVVAAYQDDGDRKNDKAEELNNPNGIVLSSDSKTLFVTDGSNILHAPIKAPGVLGAPLTHFLPGKGIVEPEYQKIAGLEAYTDRKGKQKFKGKYGPNMNIDGMSIDPQGNIYAAALNTGIVFGWNPKTKKLVRIIKCPASATNCTFGGKDGNTLFIVHRNKISSVYIKPKQP